jgi:hypothetical protein
MRLDTIKYMDRAQEELHKGIQKQLDKLKENIEQLHHSNCKRIEENTLISRRLSEIEKENAKRLDTISYMDDVYDKSHKEIEKRLDKIEGILDFTKNLLNAKIHLDEKQKTRKDESFWEGFDICLEMVLKTLEMSLNTIDDHDMYVVLREEIIAESSIYKNNG